MPVHDLKRLAAEVSAQHGIRLDPDDPMMAVVTLNRLVFEQAVAEVLEKVTSATREFNQAADKVQVRAGGVLAQEVRDAVAAIRRELVSGSSSGSPATTTALPKAVTSSGETKWLALGVSSGSVLFALGVWLGTLLR
jgi:hypothetical protein